jgi:tetratricopeptide (TPR) repeat protein
MADEPTLINASLYPRLVVTFGGRILQEISLREELTIGRADDNDLKLTDPKVSRHHARIERQGKNYILHDLGSANGTMVEGERLSGPHKLQQGARFLIGDTEMSYLEPGQAFEDTLTVPVAARAPDAGATRPAPQEGASRGLIVGLGIAGALLIVALIAVIVLALSPSLRERIGIGGAATDTQVVAVATTSVPATAGPVVQTATASPEAPATQASPATGPNIDEALEQGRNLTRRSKFEDAIAIYSGLAEQAPADARPHVGWAWALIYDDEPEEALLHAQRAVDLDPGSADALTVLARALIDTGDIEQALARAQQAVGLAPGSAEAHAVLAEAYLRDGQDQAALDEADLALVQDVNSANAHRIRAWIYERVDKDMGRAAGELQVAAGLQPELWLRRHELGLLLLDAENYNTAIIAFQDALQIRPKAVTYTAIGEAYYLLGQYDQAKASLQQALSAGAEDVDTFALMAASLAHMDRCDEALTYIDRALAIDATQPQALEAEETCQQSGGESAPAPSATTESGGAAPAPTMTTQPEPTATSKPPSPPATAVSGRIAFPVWNQQQGKYDTYVAQAQDGSGRHLVVEQMHQPAFSPDGTWLAVNGELSEHMNLFIVKPDGSGLKEISQHIEDNLPFWSPDGKSLVFGSTMHGDKQPRIYIIDEVPFEGRKQEGRPLNFGPDDVRGEYPTWTADGQIIYKGCDYTVEPAPCGLFSMPAAPGAHPFKQLTDRSEDTAPAAHGDKIVFMSTRDGNWEIYSMNADGSGLKRLTNNAANDGLPTWSPDGKTLAFVSNQSGPWAVWAMNADGSNRRKLFDIGGGGLVYDWEHERISWAP